MAKKRKADGIGNPIISREAMEEFGVSRKWLRARLRSGAIRSKKVGKYLLVDYDDFKREANQSGYDPEGDKLLEKALRRQGK